MTTATATTSSGQISTKDRLEAIRFAEILHAYMEVSDEVRNVIDDMVEIINDSDVSEDERYAAIDTLVEALWPVSHDGELGIDIGDLRELQEKHDDEAAIAFKEIDKHDAAFSERLEALMKHKSVNQTQLAERVGVHQSAISMMLSRKCHPQRRTVEKIANALDVPPDQLWPDDSS